MVMVQPGLAGQKKTDQIIRLQVAKVVDDPESKHSKAQALHGHWAFL